MKRPSDENTEQNRTDIDRYYLRELLNKNTESERGKEMLIKRDFEMEGWRWRWIEKKKKKRGLWKGILGGKRRLKCVCVS